MGSQAFWETALMSLMSGLIGAVVGSLITGDVTRRIAKDQLEVMTQNHKEVLDVQSQLLEKSILASVSLMRKEQKTKLELEFLDELYDRLTNHVHPVYEKAHHLRNDWPEEILRIGKAGMKVKIESFREESNKEIRALYQLLERNKYQGTFVSRTQEDLKIFNEVISECTTLINQVDKLGNISQTNLSFLMPYREKFGSLVTKLGDSLETRKKEIHARKNQLLSDEE